MVATRMYLTGGLGSRHRDEAFGDPFELPPDRRLRRDVRLDRQRHARLAAAPGDRRPASTPTRSSGRSTTASCRASRSTARGSSTSTRSSGGPSERRTDRGAANAQPWYACACCPPNVMRAAELVAAVPGDRRRRTGSSSTSTRRPSSTRPSPAAPSRLAMETGYPMGRHGRASRSLETPAEPWTLSLRVPGWCRSRFAARARRRAHADRRPSERTADGDADLGTPATRSSSTWTCRSVRPCPTRASTRSAAAWRSSAGRSSTASRRPTCRAVSQLEEVEVEPAVGPVPVPRADVADSAIGLTVPATRRRRGRPTEHPRRAAGGAPVEVGAVPYFAWANRSVDAMRVWIPIGRPATDRSRTAAPRTEAARALGVRPGPLLPTRRSARPPAGPSTGGPRASA